MRGTGDGANDDRVEEDPESFLLFRDFYHQVCEAHSTKGMVGCSGGDVTDLNSALSSQTTRFEGWDS